MAIVAWMLAALIIGGFGYVAWRGYGQWLERQRAAEARMASFVAQAKAPAPAPSLPIAAAAAAPSPKENREERLLFEAATKVALAGEPVLAIQLYARLLSRFPESALAAQARSAVAEQKAKLAKG